VNYLNIIFLVAVVNMTELFSDVSPSAVSSVCLMPHLQFSAYFAGYLTVNFLDVSPSVIPIFYLSSDGGYSGYYVGRLEVTVNILGIFSEGPR